MSEERKAAVVSAIEWLTPNRLDRVLVHLSEQSPVAVLPGGQVVEMERAGWVSPVRADGMKNGNWWFASESEGNPFRPPGEPVYRLASGGKEGESDA